jgi:hypothetical protein
MRARIVSFCTLVVIGGCFDPTVPTDADLRCSTNVGCPEGFTCRLERCVPLEDLASEPPDVVDVVVTPSVAGAGARVEASFAVVGALAADRSPAVEADVGRPVRLELDESALAADGGRFLFSYVVDGSESSGEVVLTALLTDRVGREREQPLGAFTIDLRAPTIVEADVVPERARLGREIAVVATLSEPATVTGFIALPDDQRVDLDVVVTEQELRATVTVDDRFPLEGRGVVTMRAIDTVSNDSGEVEVGEVFIDQSSPVVSWRSRDSLVRSGDLARFFVQSNERVLAPRLALDGVTTDPLDPDVDEGSEVAWSWLVDGPPDAVLAGDATVTVVPGPFVDLAGNEATLEPVTLVVDRTPPALSPLVLSAGSIRRSNDPTFTVTGDVSDAHGIASVAASFQGRSSACSVTPIAESDIASFACTVAIGDEDPDGLALVSVVATDRAGNSGGGTAFITLDNQGPQVVSATLGQARAAPGFAVPLTIVANEPFSWITTRFRRDDGDYEIALPTPSGPRQFKFDVTAAPTGRVVLSSIELTDMLGNVSVNLPNPSVSLTTDAVGPHFTGTVTSGNRHNPLGARVGDVITVDFFVSDDRELVGVPTVRLGAALMELERDEQDDAHFVARTTITDASVEGLTSVSVVGSDALGNLTVTELPPSLIVDTTAPQVVTGSLQRTLKTLTRAPSTPTALGIEGQLVLSWTLSEPLEEPGSMTVPDAVEAISCDGVICRADLSADAFGAEGTYALTATQTDHVGNTSLISLGTIEVDLTPPEPLSAEELAQIVHVRAPYGTTDPRERGLIFRLEGREAMVSRQGEMLVVALDANDAVRVASVQLGDVFEIPLEQDRSRIFLQVYDQAGNRADAPGRTPKTELVVGLNGRIPGQDASNPHRIELRRQFVDLNDDPSAVEQSGSDVSTVDTQHLVASPEGRWENATSEGPPRARSGAASTSHLDTLFLFGGCTDEGFSDELWTLEGLRWRRLAGASPKGPPARCGAGLTSDGTRLLLFGGENATQKFNDLWEWTGEWHQLNEHDGESTVQPTPRRDMAFGFLPASNELIVYGGLGDGVDGRQWRSKDGGTTWSEHESGPPVAGAAAGLAGDAFYIVSGVNNRSVIRDSLVRLSTEPLSVKPLPAGSGRAHACAVAVSAQSLLVIGGAAGSMPRDDQLSIDVEEGTNTVTVLSNTPLTTAVSHAACGYVGGTDAVVVFGGKTTERQPSAVAQMLKTGASAWLVLLEETPSARTGAATSAKSDSLVFFGGAVGASVSDEVYTRTEKWTRLDMNTPPVQGGAAACEQNRCIVVGGRSDVGTLRQTALRVTLDALPRPVALEIPVSGIAFRYGAAAALDSDGRLIVFGGLDAQGSSLTDTCMVERALSATELQFQCSTLSGPQVSVGAVMVATPEGPVLWAAGALWLFVGDAWVQLAEGTGPTARLRPALVADTNTNTNTHLTRLWLHGGRLASTNAVVDALWSFDLGTSHWREHQAVDPFAAGAPSPRSGHAGFFDAPRGRLVVTGNAVNGLLDSWEYLPGDTEKAALVIDFDATGATDSTRLSINAFIEEEHAITIDGETFVPLKNDEATELPVTLPANASLRVAILPKNPGQELRIDAVDIRLVRPPIIEP